MTTTGNTYTLHGEFAGRGSETESWRIYVYNAKIASNVVFGD